jgi:multidrug resistance efflux pump
MQNDLKEAREPAHAQNLPPIPTPVGTRWREVRIRYLPIMVFAVTAIAIWLMWQNLPSASGIRGIGEGAVSMLASPADGFMQQVTVDPHGRIEAGQPLLTILPFDPRSQMDMFQAQVQISRLAMEPTLVDRNALDFEQLRVDALQLKSSLAMARANLDRAEKVLPRHEALLKERLISRDVYDLSVRDRDFYRAEVEETSKALQEIDQRLEQLRSVSEAGMTDTNSAATRLLPRLEEQMATMHTNWNPITLSAPISGEVNFIRQAREFVRLGEPLVTISASRSDRIIAYLKQPMPFEPEVGMQMEVVTRNRKSIRFLTEISQVGARVEVITNSIAYIQPGALVDSGLPVILPVPPDIQIRPGEVVDVEWKRPPDSGTVVQRLFGKN